MPCLATSPSGWLPWWESLPELPTELPSELPALPCRWNQPDPDPTRDSRGKRSHHKGPETDRNRRTADMLSHLLLRSALDYVARGCRSRPTPSGPPVTDSTSTSPLPKGRRCATPPVGSAGSSTPAPPAATSSAPDQRSTAAATPRSSTCPSRRSHRGSPGCSGPPKVHLHLCSARCSPACSAVPVTPQRLSAANWKGSWPPNPEAATTP